MELHFVEEARRLRQEYLATAGRGAPLVLLEGDLGAGKTSFAKTLLSLEGIPPGEVQSPTFLKVLSHRLPAGGVALHMDAYRLEDAEDVAKIGLEAFEDVRLMIVEWPQVFEAWLAENPARASFLGLGARYRLRFEVAATEGGAATRRCVRLKV